MYQVTLIKSNGDTVVYDATEITDIEESGVINFTLEDGNLVTSNLPFIVNGPPDPEDEVA